MVAPFWLKGWQKMARIRAISSAGGAQNPIDMNIYALGTVAYAIGNIDVREFTSMTAQRKNGSGMGIGIYSVSSMSDTSRASLLGITWGDSSVHNIDLANVDYIHIWGDGSTGVGTNEIVLNY